MSIEVTEITPEKPEDFVLRLSIFDPDLYLEWNAKGRWWMIMRKDPYTGERQHIMNVVDEKGERRTLDDGWVFKILGRNSYYARNPDLLVDHIVGSVERGLAKDELIREKNIIKMINDPVMKSAFNRMREVIASVDPSEWKKPKHVRDKDGNLLYSIDPETGKQKPVIYVPDQTLMR